MNKSVKVPNNYTWIGLIISFISISLINYVFKSFFGNQLNNGVMMARELIIFAFVGLLCFFIIPKEGLKLDSIGLHNRHWGKSLLWALGLAIVLFIVLLGCVELSKVFGWKFGESKSFNKLSLPVVAFVTVRAGVAEDIFYRGYLLERLTTITGKKWIALVLSTVPFGLFHYQQGYAGILIATMAGIVLSLFYFWKRDLKANIIAHFLVDFIPNVLLAN